MQAEDGAGLRIFQGALRDHHGRAALFSGGRPFLGRLENQHHRAGDLLAHAGQDLGRPHQDRHMGVVAAGVHDRGRLAIVFSHHLRGEGQAGLLLHRQGVHVAAQGDHAAGLAALQGRHHARMRHAGAHLVAQGAEVLGHQG